MLISQSRFWAPLRDHYKIAPSVAFCRVPEVEYAAALDVTGRVLDHCCGDGYFASVAWSRHTITAGCDIDARSLEQARARGIHQRIDECDVSKKLPYDDGAFDLVFNNSSIEHVRDLTAALAEVARVLRSGGMFVFNVLNERFYEWWSLPASTRQAYREWQPVYHALNLETWTTHLAAAGLQVVQVEGYFDQAASQLLAKLDYEFSGHFSGRLHSPIAEQYKRWGRLARAYWHWRIARQQWRTLADNGGGYSIRTVKNG